MTIESKTGARPVYAFSANETTPRRRGLLKAAALAVAALAGSTAFTATQAVAATTWKVQSVWDAGTVGYTLFE